MIFVKIVESSEVLKGVPMIGILRTLIDCHNELTNCEQKAIESTIFEKDKAIVSSFIASKKEAREELIQELERKIGVKLL